MAVVFEKPSLWQRVSPMLRGFDGPLAFAVFMLAGAGLLAMYSSGYDHGTRFVDHGRNMLIAGFIMFVVAQVPPHRLMELAVPLYTLGVALLIAVLIFGITKKGARRWINLGVVIQPSEILKIAMPLMLAWWFNRREGQLRALDFLAAGVILAVPVGLIMKQPDLGTALLVLAAGLSVIFFAGLSWKLVIPPVLLAVAGIVAMVAGIMWGSKSGVQFSLSLIALKALPVLILGGFTSVPGAIIGGLIIGVGEKLAEIYVGPLFGGAIENWFAYMLALAFLLVRPQGLFGEKIIERV